MKWRNAAALAAICLVSAAAGFGAYRWWQAGALPQTRPDIALAADLDGRPRRLSEWDGKLLLVNFWATWCAPCLKEIPMLVQVQAEFGARGFQVIGPAMDAPEAVAAWLPRLGVNYPVMAGDTAIASAMDALGDTLGALPFSVLIAPDGRIVHRQHGEFTRAELVDLIEQHLAAKS